jgi:colanic acid biosynthesis glycosyl transferase WcaI
LRLQLWCWNYEPEPLAMGPIAALWAKTMHGRGHEVEVVTAHPHYPAVVGGRHVLPSHEERDGIPVLRLPLWIGHATPTQRIREEVTYATAAALAFISRSRADAIVVVSPSFLALAPAMASARLRRTPWVLWLQDIFPDAAATTGLLEAGFALRAARLLERAAYRAADAIVVISETFEENLRAKGVAQEKLVRIYNPATLGFASRSPRTSGTPTVLYMGNIGYSQGLAEVVRAVEGVEDGAFRLVITGHGELEGEVRAAARGRVEVVGLVAAEQLEAELEHASLGLVSQRPDIAEFNVPSKLMTLMARGIPVLASVRRGSEVERIVTASGGGWVTDAARPEEAALTAAAVVRDADELERRGQAAVAFARRHFTADALAGGFETVLNRVRKKPR